MYREPVSPELRKIEKDWANQSITFRQYKKRLDAIGWAPWFWKGKLVGTVRTRFPATNN